MGNGYVEASVPGGLLVLGTVLMIALIGFLTCTAVVPAGTVGIQDTFGQVSDYALPSGFAFKSPFTAVVAMDTKTLKYAVTATAASKDLQDVQTEITLNYRINGNSAATIYKQVGMNYADKVIVPAVQESVKAATAKFAASELITEREAVKAEVEKILAARLLAYNIISETVSLTDFKFSAKFSEAVEAKVTMQQDAERAQNELAKIKIEKEQTITRSEAEAQSVKNAADAKAYATLAEATAEAKAIELKGQQLKQNIDLIQYVAIEKWNGVLPTQMLGTAPVPFVDISKGGN